MQVDGILYSVALSADLAVQDGVAELMGDGETDPAANRILIEQDVEGLCIRFTYEQGVDIEVAEVDRDQFVDLRVLLHQ